MDLFGLPHEVWEKIVPGLFGEILFRKLEIAYVHWAVALTFWIVTILSLWRFRVSPRSIFGQIDRSLKICAIVYLLIYCIMLNISFFDSHRFYIWERFALAVWLSFFWSVPAVAFYGDLRRKGVYKPDMLGGLLSIFLITHTVMTVVYCFSPLGGVE